MLSPALSVKLQMNQMRRMLRICIIFISCSHGLWKVVFALTLGLHQLGGWSKWSRFMMLQFQSSKRVGCSKGLKLTQVVNSPIYGQSPESQSILTRDARARVDVDVRNSPYRVDEVEQSKTLIKLLIDCLIWFSYNSCMVKNGPLGIGDKENDLDKDPDAHRHLKAQGHAVQGTWCVRPNCSPREGEVIVKDGKKIWPGGTTTQKGS
jgi:hypothetical protein